MKQCPRCQQTYTDENLNFCLNDGELLTGLVGDSSRGYVDDSPPTIMLDQSRVTNPVNWPSSPPATWQPPQQAMQGQPFGSQFVHKKDQTLPTIALIVGILSVAMICCYGGIWLGIPAAILGFLGMRNADSDPVKYGGRGMAIGGMVLGVVSLLSSLIIAFLQIISNR